jgi:predicted nucleic acid-binding protein
MIVVADTSPINYLVLIEHIDILVHLYRRVLIPTAVHRELQHAKTPQPVREWIADPPDWLEVRSVGATPDPSLSGLDNGEAEAISLAEEISADRIVMDETFGRRIAESHGLQVIGTLGILREASQRNLLNFREAIALLQKNRFHIAQRILDDMLAES